MPVSHDAVAALFHSTRICATFPVFTPVTLPYWPVISVWVTESYATPIMSRSHARCRLLSTDKSGRR